MVATVSQDVIFWYGDFESGKEIIALFPHCNFQKFCFENNIIN